MGAIVEVWLHSGTCLPSATNGFNPHQLEEVAQQEANITGIMHAVCVLGKRVDIKSEEKL